MENNINRCILNGNFPLCREASLQYIFQLQECVNRFKRGEAEATASLEECRTILKEISDPEFPYFAVRHYRELLLFILYQLPKASSYEGGNARSSQEEPNGNVINTHPIQGREKRKYQRVKLPFPVMFRLRKKLFPSFWNMTTTEDLGIMGMLFHYKNALKRDSLVDLKIGISQTARTINCIGKIIRTSTLPHTSRPGMAIQFVYIGERERRTLNQLITKHSA